MKLLALHSIDSIKSCTDGDQLFEDLEWIVKMQLDFDTIEDKTVFWSGANRPYALDFAIELGMKTLEMTDGGRYLDRLDLFNVKNTYPKNPLPDGCANRLWDLASTKFVKQARGKVYSFSLGIPAWNEQLKTLRTWFRIELPLLLEPDASVSQICWMQNSGKCVGIYVKV